MFLCRLSFHTSSRQTGKKGLLSTSIDHDGGTHSDWDRGSEGYGIASGGVSLLLERIAPPGASPKGKVLPVMLYEEGTTAIPHLLLGETNPA